MENSIEENIKEIECFFKRNYFVNYDWTTIHRNSMANLEDSIEDILSDYKRVLKENESLQKTYDDCYCKYKHYKQFESISVQKIKDIIDRIDYDIKKTKEIISKNTNIYASYRKNDYQIVRLRAMNTKSLDIKNRLQKLLESEE